MSTPSIRVRRFSRNKFAEPDTPPPEDREDDSLPLIEEEEEDDSPVGQTVPEEQVEAEPDFLADLKQQYEADKEEPPPSKKKRGRKAKVEELPPLIADADPLTTPPPTPEPDLYARFHDHPVLRDIRDGNFPEPRKGKKTKKDGGVFGDLFGSSPTPILGADRRQLLTKIKEYKALFKDIPEVRSFKVKEGASPEQLQNAVDELDIIVSSSTTQALCDEMILSAIRMVEVVSTRTNNFDISGTADLLKQNPDFHKLCKQLTIKYRIFTALPPEYQLLMIVTSTAMVCRTVNQRKREINDILS